jgi:hypothetical protein
MRADLLKEQKLHRGDSKQYGMNFLSNLSKYARAMHIVIPLAKEKPDIFQTAMRSYIIGIAACLETYFRDLYLHTLERKPDLLETALDQIKEKEALATLYRNFSDGISFAEFAMSRATFRSVEEIDRHYSILFKPKSFLDSLDEFELICGMPAINRPGRARLRLNDGWRNHLAKIFSLRHEFAHDANSKTKIDVREMQSLETTAVILPQFASHLEPFRKEPSPERKQEIEKEMKENPGWALFPAVLLIKDLIAEDWVVGSKVDAAKVGRGLPSWRTENIK